MAGRAEGRMAEQLAPPIAVELIAVLVAVVDGRPKVMTIDDGLALPSGPFEVGHRSLQSGLRAWVERQTRHPIGYVEQLYTFADRDRRGGEDGARAISISYLGLTRAQDAAAPHAGWRDWYDYFPWEDHRAGAPRLIGETLAPSLRAWADGAPEAATRGARWRRAAIAFGLEGCRWNEELVLQRYELLFEASLVPESASPRAGRAARGGRSLDERRSSPHSRHRHRAAARQDQI